MPTVTWQSRRGELHDYFDRTAVEAWKRLTSDAPVGGIGQIKAAQECVRHSGGFLDAT